ncbi:hypothetical protein LTR29_006540 [Friedmanniomyces endolithicus]|nr:hypothetical protein LTR29_006540 [Friedmanniomyces endolithicus]
MGTGDIAQSGAVVGKDPTLLHDQYGVAAKSALKLVSTSAMASSARHLRRMHTSTDGASSLDALQPAVDPGGELEAVGKARIARDEEAAFSALAPFRSHCVSEQRRPTRARQIHKR